MNVSERPDRIVAPSGIGPDTVAAITAAIACVTVVGIGLSLSIPLLSIEMERRGASSTVIGLNTAIAGVASICTVPFVPRLASRIGVARLLCLALIVGAVSLAAFPMVPGIALWFPLRFVFSMTLGALFVLSEYWINAAAPPERRGLVMGIYATVLAAGFAVGPALLALVGTEGLAPYLTGAALMLAGGLPIVLARGLSPTIEHGSGRSILAYLRLAPGALLAALAYGAVETGIFAILPLYGLRLGYDAQGAAGLVSLIALGNVLFQIPFGWLADRFDRRAVLLGAGLGGAAGSALIPLASGSPVALGLVLFLWGGIAGTLYTVGLTTLGDRVPATDLAGANAAFVVLYNVGLMLGPPLIGGGLDLVPPHGFAWALLTLFMAFSLSLATMERSSPRS
ncbi:MFS transporter [Methylobacterium sp. J-072]|uniref:MFS transporter n=1 Tax=Methylobacterium sp. J-072 TaxID=2836651 RepID=UPI001FBB4B88|nr:MFS transporter [Methylobacterium sp. J-072]MCJ2092579.1 MFS transporter [Methylobacterium sp. J-072]